jgi:glycosyltransferase involved in cell wall biosynthesis
MLLARELGIGGSERQLTEIAKALDKSRFVIHVGYFREGMRCHELANAGISLCKLSVTSFRSPAALDEARRLGAYFKNHRIQVVHTFDYPLTCFAVPVARLFQVPVVFSSQRGSRDLIPGFYRRIVRTTDLLVDGIVTNCLALEEQLFREENLPRTRVHLCYNGIDTTRYPQLPLRDNDSPEPITIGCISAFRPEKNLGLLLEAVSLLLEPFPKTRVLLVGGGSEEQEIRQLAERLHLTKRLTLASAQNDILPSMEEIDIFVLPSTTEALSNSLMEAMACGRAVIASNVGGTPELIQHGQNGLLFQRGKVADLQRQIRRFLSEPGLRRKLGDAARRTILERFSIEQSVRRMAEIYQRAIEQKLGYRQVNSNNIYAGAITTGFGSKSNS